MAHLTRIGIIGAGWPGVAQARGCKEAGGFEIVAVADLIPQRRRQIMTEFGATREFADAEELIRDDKIDAVSICLPNDLHAPMALSALRSGKHVICETPPTIDARQAARVSAAATTAGKVLLYAFQRRFGGAEQAARQAIAKGYAGEVYHARASWMRTRGIPAGTGWYSDKSRSGGGALIDIGIHMLDLAWHLLAQPAPVSVFATTHQRFSSNDADASHDVDDSVFALAKFAGGKSLELAASWVLNQPPQQQGVLCRIYGDKGAVDVYTPDGAVLHRGFTTRGESKPAALKPPRVVGHTALMRHFRDCISGKSAPMIGAEHGVMLMRLIDAMYRSAESGKSVPIR